MTLLIQRAFKYRLSPTPEQAQAMREFAGINRFVWNKSLAINKARLEEKQPLMWMQELNFWVQLWKKSEEYAFLKDAPSQTLQQTLRHLDRAYRDGFDKSQPLKHMPRFKRRGDKDSFRYPQGIKLCQDSNRIFLPKLGWVKYCNSRKLFGDLKNATVIRDGVHWYISIQVEYTIPAPAHESESIIGLDMGVLRFVTLSNGEFVAPKNSYKRLAHRLAHLQRRLAKRVKYSANWKKLNKQINRLHTRIANVRRDFLHQLSTPLCKSHATIVVEDLNIRNMTNRATGRNVKAKSGLNRSILDQGWGMFVAMLEYKLRWAGGQLIKVNPAYTSQTCPACSHVSKENRKSQARFTCEDCGHEGHADHIAAMNVLARGRRVLACGELAL